MSEEKTGGTFLLQELEPKRLLGALVSVTRDTGPGWIHWVFMPEPGGLDLRELSSGQTVLGFGRPAAMSLAGLLPVLVAQNRLLRREREARGFVPGTEPVASSVRVDAPGRNSFAFAWETGTAGVELHRDGEQLELRIREDLAEALALRLIERLARIAVGRGPSTSTEEKT